MSYLHQQGCIEFTPEGEGFFPQIAFTKTLIILKLLTGFYCIVCDTHQKPSRSLPKLKVSVMMQKDGIF